MNPLHLSEGTLTWPGSLADWRPPGRGLQAGRGNEGSRLRSGVSVQTMPSIVTKQTYDSRVT